MCILNRASFVQRPFNKPNCAGDTCFSQILYSFQCMIFKNTLKKWLMRLIVLKSRHFLALCFLGRSNYIFYIFIVVYLIKIMFNRFWNSSLKTFMSASSLRVFPSLAASISSKRMSGPVMVLVICYSSLWPETNFRESK